MSVDSAFARLRNANPVSDPALLTDRPNDPVTFFATTQRRSRHMTIDEASTVDQAPRAPRRRTLIAAPVGLAVIVALAVAAVVSGDGEPDVAVVPPFEGAASLVGTTARVTGGVATLLPDAIEFGEDGTFRVLDLGEPIDHGTYQIEGDSITFFSEAAEVLWHRARLHGANDPSASIRGNFSCEGLGGEYQVVALGVSQFSFQAVWDECRSRIAVANRLELEMASG